jgi:nitronate monooxygenase
MTFQDVLGCELPIIQAPMAGVQDSRLAIAACSAGALGSLPCALLSIAQAREQISAIRAATERPFNVNFFCHREPNADAAREAAWRAALAPYYREFGIDAAQISAGPGRAPFTVESAELVEALKPPIVSFHFGLPPPELLARVRSSGARILASATTVDEAVWLERNGVEAIIAQGNEAGGHRGIFLSEDISTQVGTFALLPQIVRAVGKPVIAAGGIADAQGVAAGLALGAIAAQIGTAYLLCPEATTSAIHRAALKSDAARTTALTNLFTGRPARSIVNRVIRELGPMSKLAPDFPLATGAIAPLRANAEARGSGDFSPLWSGQNASGCREIGAAELTKELGAIRRPS